MIARLTLAALAFIALAPAPAIAAECDRACLGSLVSSYVDALVAHDPSRLPTSGTVRYTENSRELLLGEGVWKTVTGKGTFRHDYLDTHAQVAATHVHLLEGTTPVLYSLVLHIADAKIAGVEAIVQRITPDSRFQPTELGKPVRGLDDPVPHAERMSRADMIATALGYTEGLRIGDFTKGGTRFAPETYRVENGVVTAGEGCGRGDCGMYAQRIIVHPDISASVAAVDEANGTVLLWMNFGDTGSYGPGNALMTLEAFKVWGGQIHAINAFFAFPPKETARGWPATDPLPAGTAFPDRPPS